MRWRDDLPPLPMEEMLTDAVSEGSRRIRRRQQRLALVLGGAAVVATGLVVATVTGVFIDDSEEADRGGATVAVVPSESAATAAGTAAGGTSAIEPAETEAAGAAPGIEGAGAAATEPPETEVGATTTGPPEIVASKQITLIPAQVWEQPASGTECGPTTVAVTYTPRDRALAKAVVVWAGSFGMNQSPMEIVDNIATATIGPFPPHTVGTEIVAEPLSVTVIATDTDGSVAVLQPQVELTLAACPT